MTNLDGEDISTTPSSATTNDDKAKDKEAPKEETPVIEPVMNLLQQLEDYTPTVSKLESQSNSLVSRIVFILNRILFPDS